MFFRAFEEDLAGIRELDTRFRAAMEKVVAKDPSISDVDAAAVVLHLERGAISRALNEYAMWKGCIEGTKPE